MNSTIFFSICSLFYCVMLMFFMKSRKDEVAENKLIKLLTLINFFTLICEAGGVFLGSNYEKVKLLNSIVLRLMLVLYVVWFSVFVIYVNDISKKSKKIELKRNFPIIIITIISSLLVAFLPIVYNTNNGVITYTTGKAVDFLKMYTMGCEIVCLFMMFMNIKKIKATNYVSLFALISTTALSATIQTYDPSILLMASTETFVLFIMNEKLKNKDK